MRRAFGAIDRKAAPAVAQPLAVAVKKIQAIIEQEHDPNQYVQLAAICNLERAVSFG